MSLSSFHRAHNELMRAAICDAIHSKRTNNATPIIVVPQSIISHKCTRSFRASLRLSPMHLANGHCVAMCAKSHDGACNLSSHLKLKETTDARSIKLMISNFLCVFAFIEWLR